MVISHSTRGEYLVKKNNKEEGTIIYLMLYLAKLTTWWVHKFMYDGAAKLKSLGWFISDDLLMDFIMVSLPARYKKCTHNAHILKVYNFRKLLITCKGNMISLMNGFKRKVIKLSHQLFQRPFPLTHGGFKGRVIDYKLVSYLYDTLRAAPVCHRFCAAKLLVCQRVNAHNVEFDLWKWQQGTLIEKSIFSLRISRRVVGHALSEGLCFLFTMVRHICRMRFWFWHAWFDSYNVLRSVF
jgi:hypothetical protein